MLCQETTQEVYDEAVSEEKRKIHKKVSAPYDAGQKSGKGAGTGVAVEPDETACFIGVPNEFELEPGSRMAGGARLHSQGR